MNPLCTPLLNQAKTLIYYERALTAASGDAFNLFEILGVETDEVRTHSALLGTLLNPHGTHGLGDRPLALFARHIGIEIDSESAVVEIERYMGETTATTGGRVDLLIRDTKGREILIENKIYAVDQPNQVDRYRNEFPRARILYLTLYGTQPAAVSTSDPSSVTCISYSRDILLWLDECRKHAVSLPLVRESIVQYINLIKTLTHQNLNARMNTQIVKTVLSDRETLAAYRELLAAEQAVHDTVAFHVFQICTQVADELGMAVSGTADQVVSLNTKNACFAFEDPTARSLGVAIGFQFGQPNYRGLRFGFSLPIPNAPASPLLAPEFERVLGVRASINPWWPAIAEWREYLNWDESTIMSIVSHTFLPVLKDKVSILQKIAKNVASASLPA